MVSWTLPQQRDPHALDRLQQVQEGIYAQLQCLVPDWGAAPGTHWISQVAAGMPLHIQLLEVHPYTSFLHMTHHFTAVPEAESLPEAHVRCYHDVRIAEVTAFDMEQGIRRLAHPSLPARALLQLTWHKNRSFEKWLQYLLDLGHCRGNMRASETETDHLVAGRKKDFATI